MNKPAKQENCAPGERIWGPTVSRIHAYTIKYFVKPVIVMRGCDLCCLHLSFLWVFNDWPSWVKVCGGFVSCRHNVLDPCYGVKPTKRDISYQYSLMLLALALGCCMLVDVASNVRGQSWSTDAVRMLCFVSMNCHVFPLPSDPCCQSNWASCACLRLPCLRKGRRG